MDGSIHRGCLLPKVEEFVIPQVADRTAVSALDIVRDNLMNFRERGWILRQRGVGHSSDSIGRSLIIETVAKISSKGALK